MILFSHINTAVKLLLDERRGVWNHRHIDCLFNSIFEKIWKKSSKLFSSNNYWVLICFIRTVWREDLPLYTCFWFYHHHAWWRHHMNAPPSLGEVRAWGITNWGRAICVGNLTIIGSYNGLAPGQRQTIIWTNDGILLIGPFSKILIAIQIFSFKKMHFKMSAKWRPFCLGFNVLSIMSCSTETISLLGTRNASNDKLTPWLH